MIEVYILKIQILLSLIDTKHEPEKQTQKRAGIDREKHNEKLMPKAEDWQSTPVVWT